MRAASLGRGLQITKGAGQGQFSAHVQTRLPHPCPRAALIRCRMSRSESQLGTLKGEHNSAVLPKQCRRRSGGGLRKLEQDGRCPSRPLFLGSSLTVGRRAFRVRIGRRINGTDPAPEQLRK